MVTFSIFWNTYPSAASMLCTTVQTRQLGVFVLPLSYQYRLYILYPYNAVPLLCVCTIRSTPNNTLEEKISDSFDVYAEDETPEKKKGLFGRIGDWFKKVFKKKNKKDKDETNAPDAGSESEDGLTPKQRKKAEKALKKAERKSAKEEKKKQKQEEKLRKAQEKAAKKEAEATTDEVITEETTDTEVPVEEVPVEETTEEENAPISEDETVEETSEEEPTAEEISLENEEEVSEDE